MTVGGTCFFALNKPLTMISGGNRMTNSQTEKNQDEILTRGEAADLLKLPKRTLDYLVGTGQIPFARIGKRSVRFTRTRLLEWLSEREGIEYRLPRAAGNRVEQ